MSYVANTDSDRQQMREALGVDSIDELFDQIIPAALRAKSFQLPEGLSELQVRSHLQKLAARNASDLVWFIGGGFYDHFIPVAVDAVISRSEFYTSYTPYQPEASQGYLQAIYEYQSAICRLTDMEVSNASLYDGGTALVEAAIMAVRITGRHRILVDECVSPIYRSILRTSTHNVGLDLQKVPHKEGHLDRRKMESRLDGSVAAVVVANPNFFGAVDDYSELAERVHASGGLLVMSVHPISLGLLKTPGEMDADIVTGEGQSLGLPLSFGGPYLGAMASRKKYVRQMPGRIVGATRDVQGRRAFTLTLQTREQHIRREKATSNICSNEALCALSALAYLTVMGKEGLKEVAELVLDKAGYACQRLTDVAGVERAFGGPFFNEFVLRLPRRADGVAAELLKRGIACGLPLGGYYRGMEDAVLVAVTEKRSKEEIDALAGALEKVL